MREYLYFILSQSLLHFDYVFLLFNDLCCFLIVNAFVFSPSFFLIIKSYEMLLTYWTSYFLSSMQFITSIWLLQKCFEVYSSFFHVPWCFAPGMTMTSWHIFPLSTYNKLCCSMNKISHYICSCTNMYSFTLYFHVSEDKCIIYS